MKNRKVSDLPQITLETDSITGNWTLVCRDLPGVVTLCSKLPKLRIQPLISDCSEEHKGSVSPSSFTNRNLEHKCLFIGKQRLSELFESQGMEWETLVPSRSYIRSDTKRLARQIMHTTTTWSLRENPPRAHPASWRANTQRSSLQCLSWSLLFTGYWSNE